MAAGREPRVERAVFGGDEVSHPQQAQSGFVLRNDLEFPIGAEMSDPVYEQHVLRGKKRIESLWRRETVVTERLRKKSREIERQAILGALPERRIKTRIESWKGLGNVIGRVRTAIGVETLAGSKCLVFGRN